MASVTIVFRKEKINIKGEAPLHFRIIKNRKASYIASGIMISPRHWNANKSKVKSNCPNSSRLNSFLSNKYTEIQDTVLNHETLSKEMTSKNLREKVFGKKPSDFFAFADGILKKYRVEGKIGTYDLNKAVVSKLKDYKQSLTFFDITPEILAKYEQHLRERYSNKTNTIHKDMKFIRKVFNDAIRSDVIGTDASPFRKYKMKLEKTQRHYLTESELNKIESCNIQKGGLELYRDMFVFAAYTGGLRVSDILQLKWADFDGTHLSVVIKKTGAQVAIKVPNKGLEIIDKYRRVNGNYDDFIFPMLRTTINMNDPVALDAAISSATSQINTNLKKLAKIAEVEKRLSFHVSRHTFAVMALRKGITIDKVSKLMAHAAIKETLVYAKIMNGELDKAMDKFNN
jgi:integrase/recombinase XerD